MADNSYENSNNNNNNIPHDNDDESPRPFRRERNLSNRNFNKSRGSRRRFSTESHSSAESQSLVTPATEQEAMLGATLTAPTTRLQQQQQRQYTRNSSNSSSSSLQISYSVNSDTENAFNRKSLLKMLPPNSDGNEAPLSPDPALLDVRQKVQRFETYQIEERTRRRINNNTNNNTQHRAHALQALLNRNAQGQQQLGPLRVLPVLNRLRPIDSDATTPTTPTTTTSSYHTSIDEERSEDEVDEISDFETDGVDTDGKSQATHGEEYILAEEAVELKENSRPSPLPGLDDDSYAAPISGEVHEFGIDDFGKVEAVRRSDSVDSAGSQKLINAEIKMHSNMTSGKATKKQDFPRNYRSTRPKTEFINATNDLVVGRYNSLPHPIKDDATKSKKAAKKNEEDDEEEPELRNKSHKVIQPILDELIKTEETYVENLFLGISNYGNIFQRRDLPVGLRGKKYVLFGNIEQIAEFHRDEFLPMLHRNRRDLKRLFDEFQHYIEKNCFYGYVIFTMNKQRSLKLCDVYKNYFKLIQTELDDKLGINSFLVQPIQRMARYPLLLQQFITTLFKNREFIMKPLIESCCRLEKKLRTLLTTTNESEVINDIVDCNEFNVFYQGKFRKVSEFTVFDHTLKRNYRSKVFIFDKCIIYTEIKGKHLVFHGRYPCEHIGIVSKAKNFTLFYQRRKQQECDFHGDPMLIEQWLELIRDMVNTYVTEEKLKLQELYSRENDHLHRKPPSLSLFRDSNRFSSDSGIGNIWVMPKPESNEEMANNRTTWYAVN